MMLAIAILSFLAGCVVGASWSLASTHRRLSKPRNRVVYIAGQAPTVIEEKPDEP